MTKRTLKKITPAPIWDIVSGAYWDWRNRGRHVLAKWVDPSWRRSQAKMAGYAGKYTSKRCFIIGNGPSLRNMDLSLLQGEISFGLNRIYLMFSELGFSTTFLVSVNDLVLEQVAPDLQSLSLPKFITWRSRNWFRSAPGIIYIDTDFTGPEKFCPQATGRIFEGFTVTYVALQLAFYMGFQQVILIGVDHNFVTQGPANTTVVSQGNDPNHFSGAYFGKGFRWQLPDLAGSERAYILARQAYAQAGRQVLDATIGGKLEIFPKVDYTTLFAK